MYQSIARKMGFIAALLCQELHIYTVRDKPCLKTQSKLPIKKKNTPFYREMSQIRSDQTGDYNHLIQAAPKGVEGCQSSRETARGGEQCTEMQAYIRIIPLETSTLSQAPWDDINKNPGKLSPANKE